MLLDVRLLEFSGQQAPGSVVVPRRVSHNTATEQWTHLELYNKHYECLFNNKQDTKHFSI